MCTYQIHIDERTREGKQIWKINKNEIEIELIHIGTHSELF